MVEADKIYKSRSTGVIISPIGSGEGTFSLGGEELEELRELSPELEGKEKHVPIIKVEGNRVTVNVGAIDHPMEEDHYIEFIQLLKNEKVVAEKRLYPGDKPRAIFIVDDTSDLRAREFCNLHGLWSSE
ncbi:MAG: desulfoferrodoxin [Nanoarchaeota archaeon]|nr:desulfoferrodoxin [DPANN group archaeon]MBL7116203.1 desulfoferrodoxin [Nanoarchaeota archaeon]